MTQKDYIKVLKNSLKNLEKQIQWLQKSYNKCEKIGIKKKYEDEEIEAFETLTNRYGRTVDIIINKVFRNIDYVELEEIGSILDVINRAEKRGLVENADIIRAMKDLRNELVHEYLEEDYILKFEEVFKWVKVLIKIYDNIIKYCEKYK
jgi:uncharacterized protein YutE (UPF0331/DUF86 family)